MIHPKAIDDFLHHHVDDHHWIKTLSCQEIDQRLAEYDIVAPKSLMLHQRVALYLGIRYPEFVFMLEMGTGKTLVTLCLLDYMLRLGDIKKALILVPTAEVVYGWEDEIKRWMPHLPYTLLIGSSVEKTALARTLKTGIMVTTYAGISLMLSDLKQSKKDTARHYVLSKRKIEHFTVDLDCLILDESTKVASDQSLWFATCDKLSQAVKFRYALVGRIFGRDPQQLWPQFYLIDRGASLGETKGMFREVFFKKNKLPWSAWSYDYTFNKKRSADLTRLIGHRSIRYDVNECLDLPEKRYITKTVHLPADAETYYKNLINDVKKSQGNLRAIEGIFLRMRQISSGFLGFVDDDTGEKSQIEFATNPKLDLLVDLLSTLRSDRQAVVFHEFTFSGRKICEALESEGVTYGWLYGGTKDSETVLRDFKEGRTQVLVASWRVSAFGLNLQMANYAIYYESPIPAIERDQSERRFWRKGQERTVLIYDLIAHGTVDAKIREYHASGADLFAKLVADPGSVLGMTNKEDNDDADNEVLLVRPSPDRAERGVDGGC